MICSVGNIFSKANEEIRRAGDDKFHLGSSRRARRTMTGVQTHY